MYHIVIALTLQETANGFSNKLTFIMSVLCTTLMKRIKFDNFDVKRNAEN